jgi:hypothetical protein
MKPSVVFLLVAILLHVVSCFSQTNKGPEPSDPYKPVLDRLQSLSTQAGNQRRFHTFDSICHALRATKFRSG